MINLRALEAELADPQTILGWLRPDWGIAQTTLHGLLNRLPGPGTPVLPKPKKRARMPTPAEFSAVLAAIWQVPIVQGHVRSIYGELQRQLAGLAETWSALPEEDRYLVVYSGGTILAASVTGLNDPKSVELITPLLLDQEQAVPGVPGLSFKLERNRKQFARALGEMAPSFNITLYFNVRTWLRSR